MLVGRGRGGGCCQARLGLLPRPPLPGESTVHGAARNYPKLAVIAIRGYAVVPIRNTGLHTRGRPW